LTGERIYSFSSDLPNSEKRIPVFSGATENKGIVGYVPYYLENAQEAEMDFRVSKNGINYYFNRNDCITIVADGRAGHIFYRDSATFPIFCMNISTMALFPKKESEIQAKYPDFDGLNLKWFFLKHKNFFENLVRGEGVRHFTKAIYEKIEIEIPSTKNQARELLYLEEIQKLTNRFLHIAHRYAKIKNAHLMYGDFDEKEEIISIYLGYISRNDFLTEEEIYRRSIELVNSEKTVKVISGSLNGSFGSIPFDDGLHFIMERPCIQMVRVGKAGTMRVLRKGNYAPNSNCMLIYLKKEKLNDLGLDSEDNEIHYLHYVLACLQPIFKEYSTRADLSVFPLSQMIKIVAIKFPKYSAKIERMAKLSMYLDNSIHHVKNQIHKINRLLEKNVVFDVIA
jgi:hypothetical protein